MDIARPGVVPGQGKVEIAMILGEQARQLFGSGGDVLLRVERVGDARFFDIGGHELHQAHRAGAGDAARVAVGLGLDDGADQGRFQPVLRGVFLDDAV